MDFTEHMLARETVFQGRIVTLETHRVRLPDGREAGREVVRHPDGVAVLALDGERQAILVRQFRYPLGRELLEVPAGKVDPGEEPRAAALRELREETGLVAGELTDLGRMLPSPGFCDETLHLFLARDLRQAEACPDADEFLAVERMPLSELTRRVLAGDMTDGKTVGAALKAALLLGAL